jgi:Hemerythrin HHE cation binding domain
MAELAGCWFCDLRPAVDWMGAVSRAGGGQRQAWRRRTERDHSSVAAQDADRTVAWSRQLNQAHAALRQQLHGVQADLDSAQAGSELLAHCLAFCSVLSAHHQGEDAGLFAELLRVRPDLGDVVRKLAEDHQVIAGILAAVRDLAGEAGRCHARTPAGDRARARWPGRDHGIALRLRGACHQRRPR